MQDAVRPILLYWLFPLWVAAGFADWACHRRSGIAHTSGLRENLFHLLLFAQMGVATAAVALLEINAAVLALALAMFALHELTVYAELRYTVPRRRVGPFEQMVHSLLEILPLAALAVIAALAWPQALALAGLGSEAADWSLRWKERPLPPQALAAGALLAALFNAGPLLQETWSCLREARARVRTRTRASPAPR